jgi:glucose/arabinose dehydrogenase
MASHRRLSSVSLIVLVIVLGACGAEDAPPEEQPAPVTDAPEADAESDPEPEVEDDPGPDAANPESPAEPDLSVALQLTDVASMEAPTAGDVGPDGVLYLTERAGTVHPLTEDGLGEAVLDISE